MGQKGEECQHVHNEQTVRGISLGGVPHKRAVASRCTFSYHMDSKGPETPVHTLQGRGGRSKPSCKPPRVAGGPEALSHRANPQPSVWVFKGLGGTITENKIKNPQPHLFWWKLGGGGPPPELPALDSSENHSSDPDCNLRQPWWGVGDDSGSHA